MTKHILPPTLPLSPLPPPPPPPPPPRTAIKSHVAIECKQIKEALKLHWIALWFRNRMEIS